MSESVLDEAWMGIYRGNDSDCASWSTAEAETLELTQYARDGITMPQTISAPYWFMPSIRLAAIEADNAADAFACTVALGGPGEVCGADACGSDDDCAPGAHCDNYVCEPGP